MHKIVAARDTLAQTGALSEAQFQCCLAFELGIAEHFFDCVLAQREDRGRPAFYNFLRFHAQRHYAEDAEPIMVFWQKLVESGDQEEAVRLGRESANNATNHEGTCRAGERAHRYFQRAFATCS